MSKRVAKPDVVVDENGRQRFHGAFTGGFSAGYFNTVGSEEGFKPSSYVSSRANRAERKVYKAEDFMDEEDGLLGSLKSREEYDTFGNESKNNAAKVAEIASKGSVIPGAMPADLIVAPTKSIGKILLVQMGWKEGQGIGARIVMKSNVKEAIHPAISIEKLSNSILEDGLVTFAAKVDADLVSIPNPKDDFYGIGYDPAVENPELYGLRKNSSILSKSKGVYRVDSLFDDSSKYQQSLSRYALDDEEDDIYDYGNVSSMKQLKEEVLVNENDDFDRISSVPNAINEWLGGSAVVTTQICPSDGRPPLPGFVLAKIPQQIPEYYQPIEPPSDFKPFHKFTDEETKDTKVSQDNAVKLATEKKFGAQGLASTRAMIISNEEVAPKSVSVFDLMGPENKRKLDEIVANLKAGNSVDSIVKGKPEPEPIVEELDTRPMLISNTALATKFAGLAQAFKNRFVQSDDSVPIPTDISKKEPEVATRNDTIIQDSLTNTRVTTTWRPNPLLCKRFNVPVPEISKEKSVSMEQQKSLTGTIFGQHISEIENVIDPRAAPSTVESDQSNTNTAAAVEDITWEIDRKPRPPMSFFKSIFEDSSDDDDDDDEEEDDQNIDDKHDEKLSQMAQIVIDNKTENITINEYKIGTKELSSSLIVEETVAEELPKTIVFRKPSHSLNNVRSKDHAGRFRTANDVDDSISNDKKRHKASLSFQDDDSNDNDDHDQNSRKRTKYISNRKVIEARNVNSDTLELQSSLPTQRTEIDIVSNVNTVNTVNIEIVADTRTPIAEEDIQEERRGEKKSKKEKRKHKKKEKKQKKEKKHKRKRNESSSSSDDSDNE